jgi:hypothetical protein
MGPRIDSCEIKARASIEAGLPIPLGSGRTFTRGGSREFTDRPTT